MTHVKICGITNLEDALLSAKFGADALGFNFYEKSPRYLAPEKAREIIEQLPPEILKIGVFVNEISEKICEIAEIAKLDAIQLHGEETPEFVREIKAKTNLEIIKAFRVSPEFKPEDVLQYEVAAVLLDAYSPQEHGGTGETFDWEIARKVQEIFPKMYLAGGLSAENVWRAIRKVVPYAVDSCSSLEEQKGKKEQTKLLNFISLVHQFDKNQPFPPKDVYEFFEKIRERPAMYVGKKSLTRIQMFFYGFLYALDLQDIEFNQRKFGPHYFHEWIASKLGWAEGTSGWLNMILNEVNNDEEKAVDLFYELLDEFKLEKEDLSNE
jgi:phosphoribosylanthranilate isomerase